MVANNCTDSYEQLHERLQTIAQMVANNCTWLLESSNSQLHMLTNSPPTHTKAHTYTHTCGLLWRGALHLLSQQGGRAAHT